MFLKSHLADHSFQGSIILDSQFKQRLLFSLGRHHGMSLSFMANIY